MYYAKYGSSYLHDPFTDDILISDLSISAKVNEKGSASFTMAPSHPLYSKIQLQDPSNPVYIYDDDTILFDGYVVNTSLNFDGTIDVDCDGALGYLEQCRIRPYATSKSDDDDPSTTYIGSGYEHYIEWLFEEYNKRCDSWKQIKLGKNEATQLVTNNTVYRANSDYPTFAEEIEDKVLDSPGGYLFLRHEGSTRYVDYFKECVDVNAQIIDFGVNLLDFTKSDETSDMATAIIPVGKTGRYLVDGAEVEHMNLLEDTGGWDDDNKPSKWSINGGSEDNAVEMVNVDGINCLHRIGSVGQQDTSLRLEWNTEYTWQCKIKFASSGTVEKNNPIHCWCIYTNESSEMSVGQDALSFTYLKVQDLGTGWVAENVDSAYLTAGHWYIITQRFKTISQYSSYKYCLFRPWIANGLGNGEWWMHWMKLEKDVTPTDWSAFPEGAEMTEVDLTISNLGDGGTKVAGFYIDGDKVVYKPSRDVYGTIESEQDYSDIGDMDLLVTNAITDLISVGRPVTTIDISAIDLALIDDQYKSLVPGQLVRIRSKPHNVDEYMMLSEMSLDLSDPSNTTYTFGITYDSLTGQQSKKIQTLNAAINKSLDSVSELSSDVKNAAKDADAAMNEARKAYDASADNAKSLTDAVTRIDSDINDLQKQVDGSIETWFYDHDPGNDVEPAKDWTTDADKNKHLGDLYYNTGTGYCYRWQNQNGVYSWSRIADTDVTKALEAAKNAQDTADHKRTIFVDTPTPPYEIGDLWVQGESGDILRCATAKAKDGTYEASDWVIASKYTDDTKAEEANKTAEEAKDTADAAKEAADKAATSIVTQYAVSTDPSVAPTSGWSQTTPEYVDGQYIWMRHVITYGSGEVKTTDPALITGNQGAKGEPGEGKDGKTSYLHIAYANSEDGSVDFSVSDPVGKSYIGQYTDFAEDDSTDYTKYSWTKIKGEQGIQGEQGVKGDQGEQGIKGDQGEKGDAGRGISATAITYQTSSSGTVAPTGTWRTDVPSVTKGLYLWTRTVVTYTDNTTSTSYSVAYQPVDGDDGTSIGITSTEVSYQASTSGTKTPTGTWSTTVPTVAKGSYLWSRTVVVYSDGTTTTAYGVARMGSDGTSVTVKSTATTYVSSTSGTVTPTSGWSSSIPSVEPGSYLWSKTVVTYSDGKTTTTYTVALQGKTGASVTSLAIQYYLSTSNTTQTGGTWQDSVPEWEANHYIWQRSVTTIKMVDGTTSTQIGDPVLYGVMNSLAETVDGHTTLIQQNGDAIALRATKTELSDSLDTAKEYADAQIDLKAESITNTVASTYETKADADTTKTNLSSITDSLTTTQTQLIQTSESLTTRIETTEEAVSKQGSVTNNVSSYMTFADPTGGTPQLTIGTSQSEMKTILTNSQLRFEQNNVSLLTIDGSASSVKAKNLTLGAYQWQSPDDDRLQLVYIGGYN